jgi:predicted regulator of Ras-like GTPase activity (Roadblock/LC7/MglB family)
MCLYSEDVDGVLSVNSESNESDRDRIQKVDSLALAAANEIVQPTMRTLMQTMVKNHSVRLLILSVCISIYVLIYFYMHFIFLCD